MPSDQRPTAVFCANDLLALGLLQEVVRRGLGVPDDVALVGYDGIDYAAAAVVPLSSVRQPRDQLGRAAAQMLFEEIRDGEHHRHRQRSCSSPSSSHGSPAAAPPELAPPSTHPHRAAGYDDDVESTVVAGEEGMTSTAELAGVEIPRPDKKMFPGISKEDVARYYADVAEAMLPHLSDRPVNMQRFPDGIHGQSFYEKRVPDHFPDWVGRVRVQTSDGDQEQVVVDDERTLVYLAAQACLTPHAWLSRAEGLDTPDQMVFDLDPSGDDLDAVRRAARLTGETLGELGLTTFLKTTGSRGYHVVVPLRPADDFDTARSFARDAARLVQSRDPDLVTVEQRKEKRGDRVYVDVMRNAYGQTAVPPYAVRAREGAPVATPIDWDELPRVAPDGYTLTSLRRRLAQRPDPWRDIRRHAQKLDEARRRLPTD